MLPRRGAPVISTFEEKYGHFASALFNHASDLNWKEKVISVLKSISKREVATTWAEAISPETGRKLTIHVLANKGRGKWQNRSQETEIGNLPAYRDSMKDFTLTDAPAKKDVNSKTGTQFD